MSFEASLDPDQFGGHDLRGDLIPTALYMAIVEYDHGTAEAPREAPIIIGGLNPYRPSGQNRILRRSEGMSGFSVDGYRWSTDALLQVGGFWLPVPPAAKLK